MPRKAMIMQLDKIIITNNPLFMNLSEGLYSLLALEFLIIIKIARNGKANDIFPNNIKEVYETYAPKTPI